MNIEWEINVENDTNVSYVLADKIFTAYLDIFDGCKPNVIWIHSGEKGLLVYNILKEKYSEVPVNIKIVIKYPDGYKLGIL